MRTIRVVAAVICSSLQHKDRVLATARGYGAYKGMWEFPGGKLEAGETPQQAIVREIKEELDVKISVGELIQTIEYDYPDFHLSMAVYECELLSTEIKQKVHKGMKWLLPKDMMSLDWAQADVPVAQAIFDKYAK